MTAYAALLKRANTSQTFIKTISNTTQTRAKVVEFSGVSKAFGDRLLVEGLTFSVPPGAVVGIIGGNGAGKSTTFKMIMGQEAPDAGTIELGDTVVPMYVDQARDALDANKTVRSAGCLSWSVSVAVGVVVCAARIAPVAAPRRCGLGAAALMCDQNQRARTDTSTLLFSKHPQPTTLKHNQKVYDAIADGADEIDLNGRSVPARAYCSWYNFKGADQSKKVGDLSGGERNRLHLARVLRQSGNLLLLDEVRGGGVREA